MIRLPLDTGYEVRSFLTKYYEKNNIPVPDEVRKAYNKNETFLESELLLVTDLQITKETLGYLDYFPNLESIIISGNKSLTQQELQEVLDRYPNVVELTIEYQDAIGTINVSNLKNLQDLNIISNKSLTRVDGLDEINDLYKFTFYGNQSFKRNSEIVKKAMFLSKQCGTECKIDALYIVELMRMLEENNLTYKDIEYFNIKFAEELKRGMLKYDDHIEYSLAEMNLVYTKAKSIIDKYIKEQDSNVEKFAILYEWMCENVVYDHEAVKSDKYMHVSNGLASGKKMGTNGLFNAIVLRSCICQGYSRSMQLLLKMLDIPSFDVGCVAEDLDKEVTIFKIGSKIAADESDHSILKVNFDGKIFYSDVTWDASRYQRSKERKYFLLSKKDISIDHKLVGEEQVVDSGYSVDKTSQDKILMFAKDRIKKVNLEEKLVTLAVTK